MEIGSKEWFEALGGIVTFPAMIAFHVGTSRDDGKKCVTSKVIDTTTKVEGRIRVSQLEPTFAQRLELKDILFIEVHRIETPQGYLDKMLYYKGKYEEADPSEGLGTR